MKVLQISDTDNCKSFAILPFDGGFTRIEVEKFKDILHKDNAWKPAIIKYSSIISIGPEKAKRLAKCFKEAAIIAEKLDKNIDFKYEIV